MSGDLAVASHGAETRPCGHAGGSFEDVINSLIFDTTVLYFF